MADMVCISDYEDFLLDHSPMVLRGSDEDKAESAKAIVRYAIEYLLGWNKEIASEHLSLPIIKALRLDTIFSYLSLPRDLDPTVDFDYIVSICYNERFDPRKQTARMIDRIRRGTMSKLPKGYSEGGVGLIRLRYLLLQFIADFIPASNVRELYEQFSNYAFINSLMKEKEIFDFFHNRYRDPLTCLHSILEDGQRDEFYYSVYQYLNVIREIEKEENKKAAKIPRHHRLDD